MVSRSILTRATARQAPTSRRTLHPQLRYRERDLEGKKREAGDEAQHRAVLAASAVLAVMVPPTGADFNFRAYQLPMAVLAGIGIALVALLWVRRIHGRRAAEDDGPVRALR